MTGNECGVTHIFLTDDRLSAISGNKGNAGICIAIGVGDRNGFTVLFDAFDTRVGMDLNLTGFLCTFNQASVDVSTMDDGIRVAKTLAFMPLPKPSANTQLTLLPLFTL